MIFEVDEIKRRRKKLGITQKRLAELVGVSQPLIARIESGDIDPKLSLVKKIFEVLEELEGKHVTARSIMNSPVISVPPDANLREAIEIMRRDNISQIPVMESGRVLGSITESSVVRIVLSRGLEGVENLKVREVMEDPLPTVEADEKLETISRILLSNPAVLVVENGKIVGIITKHDVMKVMGR